MVQTEYDKGFQIFGQALARYEDSKTSLTRLTRLPHPLCASQKHTDSNLPYLLEDMQIELLRHKSNFLENVLVTLQTFFGDASSNPLDYLSMERHTSDARTGVLQSLKKAVTSLATVPQRQIVASPTLKLTAVYCTTDWKVGPSTQKMVSLDLLVSKFLEIIGSDVRVRVTEDYCRAIKLSTTRTLKDQGVRSGDLILYRSIT